MYPDFEIGQYDETMKLKAKNVSLGTSLPYLNPKDAPLCSNCDINEFCKKGCLGSQYETTKSILPFSSINTPFAPLAPPT